MFDIKNSIKNLAKQTKVEEIIPEAVEVKYDPLDLALSEPIFVGKRLGEYFTAQTVYKTGTNMFTGMLRFDKCKVPGDCFTRQYHRHFYEAYDNFYNKYKENLVVFEWQHSSPNYEYILKNGVIGSLKKVEAAQKKFRFDKEKYEYLEGVKLSCKGLIAWAEKCSKEYFEAAENETDTERKEMLISIAENCKNVPKNPAKSFYEGLQSVLFCFYCLPDSIGTLDRYMFDLYDNDIKNGVITREQAKYYLQEFFIHLSAFTRFSDDRADKSAECHFAIGGYSEKGEDNFNDLSHLIIEALMEIDTRRPAISLRYTKKTPYEVLRFVLDCERKDKNKRIALVCDEPRIKGLTEIVGLPYSEAVKYTMVGCNEPAFPGAIWLGGTTTNIARCMQNTIYNRKADILKCKTFDEFYAVFKEELEKDIDRIFFYIEKFNAMRSKDTSILSNFLLDGCIESGTPYNRYGCKTAIAGLNVMGLTSVIDSLTIISQFVFDEKRTTMEHLIETLELNWESDCDLHTEIINEGKFFGNNDELSDNMARRFTTELYNITQNYTAPNGAKVIIGTLSGYNPHYVRFGEMTKATPDGRFDGEAFMVGSGQAKGKDRNGLIPIMKSLALMDPTGIMTGPVVCNMLIDEQLIKNDEYFEKFCKMVETYFKIGGMQIQLNYVSKEELLSAQKTPEDYKSLKVRVSGFSATFINLEDGIQNDIISRTTQRY